MKSRHLIFLAILLTLVLGATAVCYGEDDPSDDGTGTVTRISEKMVTFKEANGKERTLEVKDLKGLKTGDFVIIEDFKVRKINPERKKGLDIK